MAVLTNDTVCKELMEILYCNIILENFCCLKTSFHPPACYFISGMYETEGDSHCSPEGAAFKNQANTFFFKYLFQTNHFFSFIYLFRQTQNSL